MRFSTAVGLLLAAVVIASGQEGPTYRVDLNMRDAGDASAKEGRHYMVLVESGTKGYFRVGSKIPYATGSFQPGVASTNVSPLVATQFNYVDVGVSIECFVREVSGKFDLKADIELSTVKKPDGPPPHPPNPIIGSVRVSFNGKMTAGTPTKVASINDPATGQKFDVEATVTRMD